MIVTGRVSITNIGFTIKFKRLNTMATIIAVKYVSTDTFGSTFDNMITARALRRIRSMSFIWKFLVEKRSKAGITENTKIRDVISIAR